MRSLPLVVAICLLVLKNDMLSSSHQHQGVQFVYHAASASRVVAETNRRRKMCVAGALEPPLTMRGGISS